MIAAGIFIVNPVSDHMTHDTCPLHVETKQNVSADSDSFEGTNVSCFAEFLFISTTLLFRIASFCLLLWVFMVSLGNKQLS